MKRRNVLKGLLTTVAGAAILPVSALSGKEENKKQHEKFNLKGNVNHSVCWWTYDFLSLDALCKTVKKIGVTAIDLVGPKDWNILKENGMYSSMCNGAEISISEGWNNKQYHSTLIKNHIEYIQLMQKAGYKNLICFSGNKKDIDDETGLKNCEEGLKHILGDAEKNGVIIQMEVLNKKVDHPDYMANNTKWAVELCKRIDSPNFKILYDIYHMQIMEGDIIATIQKNHEFFGHYHTAGVPGRHEINDTQELYYPAIIKAIVNTGYKGYLAQEFFSTGKTDNEKINMLKEAIHLCDV